MTYAQLFEKLREGAMPQKLFHTYIKNIGGLCVDIETEIEMLKATGAPLQESYIGNEIYMDLATKHLDWQEACFCFVDIETNGAKPQSAQIIEIGAIKMKKGKMIDHFESYVYAKEIPENITQLTGICYQDIAEAPSAKSVLSDFQRFLGKDVFVAHNVNFDYGFIHYHLQQCGLFGLFNPKLCTIELAKKTILSPRYALSFLNELLGIGTPVAHRAYADALTSLRIFEIATMMIPPYIQSLQNLIDFSKGRIKTPAKISS